MSKFQPRHTKWALTACLLGALGFSASLPTKEAALYALRQEQGMNDQLLQFASTDPDVKRVKVKNLKGEEGEVIVKKIDASKSQVISYKTFEGGTCDAGGACLSSRVLDVPFEADAQAIGDKLMLKIAEEKMIPAATPKKDESVQDEVQSKRERDKEMMKRIVVKCEREEGDGKAKCVAERFLELLKGRRTADMVNSQDAYEFYIDEVEQGLKDMLLNTSTGNTDYAKASSLIRKLESGLPKNYNRIRESAAKMVTDSLKKQAATMMNSANTAAEYANVMKKAQDDANLLMQQRQQAINANNMQGVQQIDAKLNSLQSSYARANQQYDKYASTARAYRDWINNSYAPMLNSDILDGLNGALNRSLITQDQYNNMYNPFDTEFQRFRSGDYKNILVNPASVNLSPSPTVSVTPTLPAPPVLNSGRGTITFGPATRQVNPNVK